MTKEEAIAYFKEDNEILVSVAKDENVYDYEKKEIEADCMRRTFEANEKAIQALEQQPCEDCISREDAINVVHKYFVNYLKLNDDICLDGIRSLPSVTPQPKRGKWIEHEDGGYDCSNCCEHFSYNHYHYCPCCGSQNREVEKK